MAHKKVSSEEKVSKVRTMIKEIESSHPQTEYTTYKRTKFPKDIDLDKLVKTSTLPNIKKGLEYIDKYYPQNISSGGFDTNTNKDYSHIIISNAKDMIDILNSSIKNKLTEHSFSINENAYTIARFKHAPIAEAISYAKKGIKVGANPTSFLGTISNILGNINNVQEYKNIPNIIKKLESEYDNKIRRILDPWNNNFTSDTERDDAIIDTKNEFRNEKTRLENKFTYYEQLNNSDIFKNIDFHKVAESLLKLYKICNVENVNSGFTKDFEVTKNNGLKIEIPSYYDIPFDTLMKKFEKNAKIGISPNTYISLYWDFQGNNQKYEIDTIKDFESDIAQLSKKLAQKTSKSDSLIRNGLLYGNQEHLSLPETIGYESTKKLLQSMAQNDITPQVINELVTRYHNYDYKKKNTEPTRLELIQSTQPNNKILDILNPLFELESQSKKLGVHNDDKEGPIEHILSDDKRYMLLQKRLSQYIQLGTALLDTKMPVSKLLSIDFYRTEFDVGVIEELSNLMKELGKSDYKTWNKNTLIEVDIPRSQEIIREVGISQFIKSMQYSIKENIDLQLTLHWGIPIIEDTLINQLRSGNSTTTKNQYTETLTHLEHIKGAVNERERTSIITQLKNKISEESTLEVHIINNYIKEFDNVNKQIVASGLEKDKVYFYLRKEKFDTLEKFVTRSNTLIKELHELPTIIKSRKDLIENLTLEEKQHLTEQGIKRYTELSKLIGGDDNFTKLSAEASQNYYTGNPMNIWDNIQGYGNLLGTILSLIPLPEKEYQTIINNSKKYRDNKDAETGVYSVKIRDSIINGLATEMRKREIGAGITLAEIGGSIAKTTMETLGANTQYTNGGYAEGLGVAFAQSRMDIIKEPTELVMLDHYKHKFSTTYDITVTNKVFDTGSGVGAIAGDISEADKNGTMELLAIFSNITKNSGYSIHGDFELGIPATYLTYLGFTEIRDAPWDKNRITVLRKNTPKPEIYPQGIAIGRKVIDYNKETKEFYIKH